MINQSGPDTEKCAGEQWIEPLLAIASKSLADVPPMLVSGPGREVVNVKVDNDPTIKAEIYVEELAADVLAKTGEAIQIFTEERTYIRKDAGAKYVVLIDPIDATFLALRNLPGASTALCVIDLAAARPVAAVIGDYFTQDLYWATEKGAFRNGKAVSPSKTTYIEHAVVSTCYGKASRLKKMLSGGGMITGAHWLETTGGILSMVRVGTGQMDAYFDFMLGYKPYDFAAGAYFVEMAGGAVANEYGQDLVFPQDQTERCKFVLAANPALLFALVQEVNSAKNG